MKKTQSREWRRMMNKLNPNPKRIKQTISNLLWRLRGGKIAAALREAGKKIGTPRIVLNMMSLTYVQRRYFYSLRVNRLLVAEMEVSLLNLCQYVIIRRNL